MCVRRWCPSLPPAAPTAKASSFPRVRAQSHCPKSAHSLFLKMCTAACDVTSATSLCLQDVCSWRLKQRSLQHRRRSLSVLRRPERQAQGVPDPRRTGGGGGQHPRGRDGACRRPRPHGRHARQRARLRSLCPQRQHVRPFLPKTLSPIPPRAHVHQAAARLLLTSAQGFVDCTEGALSAAFCIGRLAGGTAIPRMLPACLQVRGRKWQKSPTLRQDGLICDLHRQLLGSAPCPSQSNVSAPITDADICAAAAPRPPRARPRPPCQLPP